MFWPGIMLFLATGPAAAPPAAPDAFAATVLAYRPVRRPGVTDAKYALALRILDETRSATKGDPAAFNVDDYWNATSAFAILHEDPALIRTSFASTVAADPAAACALARMVGSAALQRAIPETFLPFYADCLQRTDPAAGFDPTAYAAERKLDPALVRQLWQVQQDDQRYRQSQPVDWTRQRPLDLANRKIVRALHDRYGRYVGKALAGEKLAAVMWIVVQHADLATMETYLPTVHRAVAAGDLDAVPLKMLLDRIHAIKIKHQIFGSQGDVPLAPEDVRQRVAHAYGLS